MELPVLEIERDSQDYDVLYEAACLSLDVPGPSVELGVRAGGGSEVILRANATRLQPRLHIAIDPWAGLAYACSENDHSENSAYDNPMKRKACADLYRLAHDLNLDLVILPWKDHDFFTYFEKGFPYYQPGGFVLAESYSFVHFDAQHTSLAVRDQLTFFAPRTPTGGTWVFDDINNYPHKDVVEPIIFSLGFVLPEISKNRNHRAAYVKA